MVALQQNVLFFCSENDLIAPRQSGFRPGDSWKNQLLSTAHKIFSVFYNSHEVRVPFSIFLKHLIGSGTKAC